MKILNRSERRRLGLLKPIQGTGTGKVGVNRRRVIAAMSAMTLLFAGQHQAAAQLLSGYGASVPAGTLLQTMVIANDAGGASAANAITHMKGLQFKNGDIPNGDYPAFFLKTGTPVAYSMTKAAYTKYWANGSLQSATFMWRLPSAIPAAFTLTCTTTINSKIVTTASTASLAQFMGVTGTNISVKPTGISSITNGTTFVLTENAVKSGSVTLTFNGVLVDVKTGGTGPGTSSRSLSDFTNCPLKSTAVGMVNWSGGAVTYTSDLNQGISQSFPDTYQFMDGACGAVWAVTAHYRASGSNEGQMHGRWFVQSLENAAGGQYGFRELCGTYNGFYDVASNNYRVMTSLVTDDGLGNSFDCWPTASLGRARTCTAAIASGSTITSNGNAFNGGEYVIVTADPGVTPPAPFVVGQGYFVQGTGGATAPGTNTFSLSNSSTQGATRIVVTADQVGAGNWYITPFPWVVAFGAIWDAGANARPRFYQGSTGTVSTDAALRVSPNPYYLRSTGLWLPFDLEGMDYKTDVNGIAGKRPPLYGVQNNYFIGTADPLGKSNRNFASMSPEPRALDYWGGSHACFGDANSEQATRMLMLCGSQFGIRLRSGQSGTFGRTICPNNGHANSGATYSGMPAPAPTLRWDLNTGHTANFPNAPTTTGTWLPGFDSQGFDHWTNWFAGAALAFREPQHLEYAIAEGTHAIVSKDGSATGNVTINNTTWISTGSRKVQVNVGVSPTRCGVIAMGGSQQAGRSDAWAMRSLLTAGIHVTAGYGEYQMFNDMVSDTIDTNIEIINISTRPAAAQAIGIWYKGADPGNFYYDPWQQAYFTQSAVLTALALADINSGIMTLVGASGYFHTKSVSILGLPEAVTEQIPCFNPSTDGQGSFVTTTDQIYGQGMSLAWTNSSPLFTWNNPTADTLYKCGYRITSGDVIASTVNDPPSDTVIFFGSPFVDMQPYYIERVSDATFYLHLANNPANWGTTDPPLQPSSNNASGSGHQWYRVNQANVPSLGPAASLGGYFGTVSAASFGAAAVGAPGLDNAGLTLLLQAKSAGLLSGDYDPSSDPSTAVQYLTTTL